MTDALDTEFGKRHAITCLKSEARAMRRRLTKFYEAASNAWRNGCDIVTPSEVQGAFRRWHPDCGKFCFSDAKAVSMILRDMPDE